MIRVLALAVAAYLLGSLPTATLAARVIGGRFGPHGAGVASVGLDFLVGILAVTVGGSSGHPLAQSLAATAVIAGHQWPVVGGAAGRAPHGGAALAVAAGALTVVTPIAVPVWGVLWAIVFVSLGYRAAAAAVATLLFPAVIGYLAGWAFGLLALPGCLLLLDRYRPTMRRILDGSEPKHHWRGEA